MTDNDEQKCPLCPQYTKPIPLVLDWISCEYCNEWFHYHCLNLPKMEAAKILKYSCLECSEKGHATEYKRSSGRSKVKVDYVALNDGDVDSSYLLSKHPHIESFINWESKDDAQGIEVLQGNELTVEYALSSRMTKPVKIPFELRDGLGLDIPNFDIDDLIEHLGEDYPIEVMDVLTQESTKTKFNLSQWRDYYINDGSNRDRILNVLSLEISQCSLGSKIKRPNYVEEIDLVDKAWPEVEAAYKPKVSKYCLMGVENCYTDFHLDFAGTSVYYTVLRGCKQFLMFPPTELNLKKFQTWTIQPDLNKQFLGNLGMEHGLKVELNKGDVFIIPSGWIHAVYTPVDSLVIGGNFLTSFNIVEQLKVIDIEFRTKVDKKFKFPNFNRLMWFTVDAILQERIKIGKDIDLMNCKELLKFLDELSKKKVAKDKDIPFKIIGNPTKFLKKFESYIEKNEAPEQYDYENNDKKRKLMNDISLINKKIKQ